MTTRTDEQDRALLPCPFCDGSVSFHQDDEECRNGCHYIECKTCGTFDLSTAADPTNTVEELGELRARIAPLWNRRAALQSQDREDAERYRWIFTAAMDEQTMTFATLRAGVALRTRVKKYADEAIDHARRIEGDGE